MRPRNDTLGMMSNPLVGQMFDPAAMDMNEDLMIEREAQKEHELRILGTMLFQAFFLSMCILLYERWEWSQFNNTWEALVFWFTASFALQAGFYFVYRAGFEDTNNHRKGLRRMRQSNKRRLALIKYQQEKRQLETVLSQQLDLFERSYNEFNSDGVIDAQESAALGKQASELANIMSVLQSMQGGQQQQPQKTLTPADVGLGRMDIMGLPIGPKLTVASIPDGGLSSGQSSFQGGPPAQHLNLQPSGTRVDKEIEQGQAMEALNESL